MERFTWDQSLSTGHPTMDAHHKELFYAINDLADAVEQGKGESAIKKLLVFMGYYAEWHFEKEENCMKDHHCPLGEANSKAHQQFLQTFKNLSQELKEKGASNEFATRIHGILSEWLVDHILKIDATNLKACANTGK
ncbi:MAG: hemerythrin family protein [Microcystaceae cyanobacterium]